MKKLYIPASQIILPSPSIGPNIWLSNAKPIKLIVQGPTPKKHELPQEKFASKEWTECFCVSSCDLSYEDGHAKGEIVNSQVRNILIAIIPLVMVVYNYRCHECKAA